MAEIVTERPKIQGLLPDKDAGFYFWICPSLSDTMTMGP